MRQTIWNDIKFRIIGSQNSLIHLIAINVVAFLGMAIPVGLVGLFGVNGMQNAYEGFGEWMFLPGDFLTLLTRPWTLVTHFFLHSFSIRHILWNMLFLWWFGRIFHSLMGNQRSIQLYVLSGLVGGLSFMIAANILPTMSPENRLVGASGAVTGFILAATTLNPLYSIRLLFFGDVKIWMIAAFFVVGDLIFIAENTGGRIAHLAGGLTGYLFVTQLKNGNDFGAWISRFNQAVLAFFKPKEKSKFKVHSNPSGKASSGKSQSSFSNAVSQEEIDAILDKISKSGYDSLSKRERDILFKVSDKN
ncbi:MAG: rhomboid family intramembrane serine protease [Bacteroidia bacterium]